MAQCIPAQHNDKKNKIIKRKLQIHAIVRFLYYTSLEITGFKETL
jgi:hypothetical protein